MIVYLDKMISSFIDVANSLVADYQKMKAYAAVLAEETVSNFDYKEIPLNSATSADLNLIELAIFDDENDSYGEDWTSILGINLRYCVRVKKNDPLKRVQRMLTFGGLVACGSISSSNALGVEWQSRKSRTKPRADHPQKCEPCKSLQSSGVLQKNTDSDWVKNVIQYSRRKSKLEPRDSEKVSSRDLGNDINSSLVVSAGHEVQVLEASGQIGAGLLPARVTDSPAVTSQFVGSVEVQIINQSSDGMDLGEEARSISHVQDEHGESNNSHKTCSSSPYEAENNDDIEIQRRNIGITEGVSNLVEHDTYNGNGESTRGEDTQMRRGEDTQVNEILEPMHSQTDDVCLEIQTAFLKEDKAYDDSPSHAEANKHTDSVKKCQEAPVTEEECDEPSKGTYDGQSSDTASSDNEPQQIDCTTSNSDNKLECELRFNRELDGNEVEVSSLEGNVELGTEEPQFSMTRKKRKRKGEVEVIADDKLLAIGFVRSPCEGLRPRTRRDSHITGIEEAEKPRKKVRQSLNDKSGRRDTKSMSTSKAYSCNLEGCQMSFNTKEELSMHRRNRCHYEGCGKKFSSHKYAILHQRVHEDDRPLKCPWKGCQMSFKWAWARTEHIRVHTGERPYKCKVGGCGLSFRFISDYNRHRRKTGHYVS